MGSPVQSSLSQLGGKGGGGGGASFGPPDANQQSWMSQMGWGSDLNALTPMQRGGLNTAMGATDPSNPDYVANPYYNTPAEFVAGVTGNASQSPPSWATTAPAAASTQPALIPNNLPGLQSQGKGGANTGGGLSASMQPAYAPTSGAGAGGAGAYSTPPGIQSLQGKGGGSSTGGLY